MTFSFHVTQRNINRSVLAMKQVSLTDAQGCKRCFSLLTFVLCTSANIVQADDCLCLKDWVTGINVAELFCQVFSLF